MWSSVGILLPKLHDYIFTFNSQHYIILKVNFLINLSCMCSKSTFFSVRINNTLSELHSILCGIIQSSILSPTLFNLYFYDIHRIQLTFFDLYANDTTIYATVHHLYFLYKNIQHYLLLTYIYLFPIPIDLLVT